MVNDSHSFLFNSIGAAPISFQTVSQSSTWVLVLGFMGLALVAWVGRKDSRVWLAPLALFAFLGVVETEKYLDRAERFDQLAILSTGVQVDSNRDRAAGRFIPFEQINRIENGRSGRFGDACRLRIALISGELLYSVNFIDHRGACAGIKASGIAISSVPLPRV